MSETISMAMPWYTPESWQQLKAVADDKLCGTHADFVRKTTQAIRRFKAEGVEVEKVLIDVGHMVAWCRRWGYRVDARGRAAYGAMLACFDGELFDLDTPVQLPEQRLMQ